MRYIFLIILVIDLSYGKKIELSNEIFSSRSTSYIEPHLILIKKGSFYLGNDKNPSESPKKKIEIKKPFYISKYEVTFEEYDLYCKDNNIMPPNDNGWGRGKKPVIYVSFEDAKNYTKWLSKKTGKKYKLPTEIEWEYAFKSNSTNNFKQIQKNLKQYAWFDQNSYSLGIKSKYFGPQEVGKKLPNQNKIHDMLGNVWEWCDSDFTIDYTHNKAFKKDYKVLRGGCWASTKEYITPTKREGEDKYYSSASDGFRVVMQIK
jgi:formylglycine-generating enzyme required for sulfatase activity